MVKCAKRALSAILTDELQTAFTGVEALISQPLTYQSADPNDNVPYSTLLEKMDERVATDAKLKGEVDRGKERL